MLPHTLFKKQLVHMIDETSFLNLVDALCEYKHVTNAEELCLGKDKNFQEKIESFEMGTT